uniref:Uncharacterized protein n=1 Tax=Kalanchoe fedtschenkoi TaxID=63787 RepID=A0A7N0URB4_KALFE
MCLCILFDTAATMPTVHRSGPVRKSRDTARIVIATILGMVFGFFFGVSFPSVSIATIHLPSSLKTSQNITSIMHKIDIKPVQEFNTENGTESLERAGSEDVMKIFVATNPKGAESLPPGIVVSESDLFLRRLWGNPSEDIKKKPKYLVTFTVGLDQMENINAAVKKVTPMLGFLFICVSCDTEFSTLLYPLQFSDDFQILLFHYDGRTSEWNEYEWSQRTVHVSVKKQTKWWYAKRFLHPDIVAAYEYIFIWDEDLGVEHFDPAKYIALVEKYGLEISQPGLEPNDALTWEMTKKRDGMEVHKYVEEKSGWCAEAHLPPCAAYSLTPLSAFYVFKVS